MNGYDGPRFWIMDGRAHQGCTDEQFDKATVMDTADDLEEAREAATSQANACGFDVEIWDVAGVEPKWIERRVPKR